jgi:hypothetical protein
VTYSEKTIKESAGEKKSSPEGSATDAVRTCRKENLRG